ncbi:MAG: DNA polymerase I [Treponema sp.]|jgi:DNA polymerase-1|nr:DNA polymerase I [Treponema sp.]
MSLNSPAELPPLYLIDSYGLIYRSYFAMYKHPLRNNSGKNISALFGFSRTVVSLLNDGAPLVEKNGVIMRPPTRLVAVFDSITPTFRHKQYPEYKAKREKAPEDLHEQVPLIYEFLTALGIPVLRVDGFEADDIIATLVQRCQAENRQCYMFSSDKDLYQLIGNGTYQLRPVKAGTGSDIKKKSVQGEFRGLNSSLDASPVANKSVEKPAASAYELVGVSEVEAQWGVPPSKMLDMLSLSGDSSDNIPGVYGIGEVAAVKLMSRYGSLDEIYRNLADIKGAAGKNLAAGKESAYLSQSLIRLEYSVPLSISSVDDALSIENLNPAKGAAILLREGVRKSAIALTKNDGQVIDDVPAPASAPQMHYIDPALLGDGVYKTLLDFDELKALIKEAKAQGFMALDFETDSLDAWHAKPVGISIALRPKEAVYVPLAAHEGTAPFLEPEQVKALLVPFFADPAMAIIAHNAKYDYEVSRAWGIPRWQCKIWDTMIAAWLSAPERGNYSLDSLSTFHFSYTPLPYFSIVPKGTTFDAVPLEIATRYSAEDADLTMRLKTMLEPRLRETEVESLFLTMEMPLLPILAEMEGEGIKIEKLVLEEYGKELAVELESLKEKTFSFVGHEFNLLSTKQLQDVLFVERGLKPSKKTKTGFSTDVAVLEELAKEDEVPALILRHRTLAKLKSTYVDALAELADVNGRLHTSFVQTGTVTGRLSSREPNLQNIPVRDEEGRRIREAFVADTGKTLISADYSQIELVVLAHLSGDENLVSAFRLGKDVHARTAALIFGIDEAEVLPEQRRVAKVINFGVMYGMSAFRLANELGIRRTEASAFIETYFKTYSGINRLVKDLVQKAEQSGYASTIFGRRRYIPAINSLNKTEKAAAERVAVNTPIQGSAADIVKIAMLNLDKRLSAEKSPARLLLQVHDELILEAPAQGAEDIARIVKEEMENAVALSVPLRVGVEIGRRWGDFH